MYDSVRASVFFLVFAVNLDVEVIAHSVKYAHNRVGRQPMAEGVDFVAQVILQRDRRLILSELIDVLVFAHHCTISGVKT
jgi:hypothetical protein